MAINYFLDILDTMPKKEYGSFFRKKRKIIQYFL